MCPMQAKRSASGLMVRCVVYEALCVSMLLLAAAAKYWVYNVPAGGVAIGFLLIIPTILALYVFAPLFWLLGAISWVRLIDLSRTSCGLRHEGRTPVGCG